jgi:hypothetical protein
MVSLSPAHFSACQGYGSSKLKEYEHYARKADQETAVVIIGYNRPYYFKELIASLEANPESQTLPFFFILDGGDDATPQDYVAIIKKSQIKNKHIFIRPYNYGLHRNIISGLRFMFDWCGFKRIVHFEDDIVVTPDYIGLMLRLDEWAHATYDNIGAVQGFRPCRLSSEEKVKNLSRVAEFAGNWLGYCMRQTVWDSIKSLVYEYETKFLYPGRWRPEKIKRWMYEKLAKGRAKMGIRHDRSWSIPLDSYYTYLPEMGVGQCGLLTMSLFLQGYTRLTTVVNRAITIGAHGANYRKELWLRHYEGVSLTRFPEDKTLSLFEPLYEFVY